MIITLKKAADPSELDPLTWGIWEHRTSSGDHLHLVVVCGTDPNHHKAIIAGRPAHNWQIAPDGTVTPSILIPSTKLLDGTMTPEWHEFVKLEGWSPCFNCKDNETHTVGYGQTDYADEQLKAGRVFCTAYHGWVVPCKERQPTCGGAIHD